MKTVDILLKMRAACPVECEVAIVGREIGTVYLTWSFKDCKGVRCGHTRAFLYKDIDNDALLIVSIEDAGRNIKANIQRNGIKEG